jgi:heat shock protein HtpX
VTSGLLEKMNRVELEGVLAHELSHIKNYDILVSTLAVTMVGAIAIVSDTVIRMMWWNGGRTFREGDRNNSNNPLAFIGFLLLLIAPLLAQVMHFAVSRRRESLADVSAVAMTRYPPGLIAALEKLRDDTTVTHAASRSTAHLWIEEPLARTSEEGKLTRLNRLFDTHPPLEERIAALREL